jgi:hypothetical protein
MCVFQEMACKRVFVASAGSSFMFVRFVYARMFECMGFENTPKGRGREWLTIASESHRRAQGPPLVHGVGFESSPPPPPLHHNSQRERGAMGEPAGQWKASAKGLN